MVNFESRPNDPLAVYRRRVPASTTWCSDCDLPVRDLVDDYECHSCRDWDGCGGDCSVYGQVCPGCDSRVQTRDPR